MSAELLDCVTPRDDPYQANRAAGRIGGIFARDGSPA